jgi:uncharacterized DUF497 family protein
MHNMWTWDERKRQANLAKQGVDFTLVARFDWATATIEPDERQDYGELRLKALGRIWGRLHFVAFTRRNGETRIFSLRKANRREQRYWESQRP